MEFFDDARVRQELTPRLAVDAMCGALRSHGRGELFGPARLRAEVPGSMLVFTAGGDAAHYGYRSYGLPHLPAEEQIVVAHDRSTGALSALAVGRVLGARRTGALGAAAASLLASPGPHRVALIGSGKQARNQLWALRARATIADVRVFSRGPAGRQALATRAHDDWQLDARCVDSAREAVEGASIVILATGATTPVIDRAWLEDDVLVMTLGGETQKGAEYPASLLVDAFLTTDSPDQLRASPHFALPAGGQVVPLGQIAARLVGAPQAGRRVYLSRGLSGTEVVLLAALASAAQG